MEVRDHEAPNMSIYFGELSEKVPVMGKKTPLGVEINDKQYALVEGENAFIAVRKRVNVRNAHRSTGVRACPHIQSVLPSSLTITEDGELLCPQCAKHSGYSRYFDVSIETDIPDQLPPYTVGYELEAVVRSPWPQPPFFYHSYLGARYPWPHDWRHETDASISSIGGAELISTFTDASDWLIGEAVVVTSALERLGWVFSHQAGMHVNVGTQIRGQRFMAIEEAVFALGANVLRYLNSRYATPLKQPNHRSGHHSALANRSRHVSEIRAFEAARDLNDILFKVGLAGAVAYYLRHKTPPKIDPDMTINEAAVTQAEDILDFVGWQEGGRWIGYPYLPQKDPIPIEVVAQWGNRVERYEAVLEDEKAIIAKIERKLMEFYAAIKIGDIIEIGGGQIEGGDI